jgi:hypothetical protein
MEKQRDGLQKDIEKGMPTPCFRADIAAKEDAEGLENKIKELEGSVKQCQVDK